MCLLRVTIRDEVDEGGRVRREKAMGTLRGKGRKCEEGRKEERRETSRRGLRERPEIRNSRPRNTHRYISSRVRAHDVKGARALSTGAGWGEVEGRAEGRLVHLSQLASAACLFILPTFNFLVCEGSIGGQYGKTEDENDAQF